MAIVIARIVDEDVDAAQRRFQIGEDRLQAVEIGQVAAAMDRRVPGVARQPIDQCLTRILGDVDKGDAGALRDERLDLLGRAAERQSASPVLCRASGDPRDEAGRRRRDPEFRID